MVFDETDHLSARFELLDGLVEGHVVVEGTHTHQGEPLGPSIAGSRWLPDNAIMCLADLGSYTEPWDREHAQRDFIGTYVKAMVGEVFEPDDILVVCDADEHVNPEIVPLLAEATDEGPVALSMQMCYYGLDWEDANLSPGWLHARALRVRDLPASLSELRLSHTGGGPQRVIVGAGWHISYVGGPARRAAKLRAYAHAEQNNPETHARIATAHETGIGPNGEKLVAVTDWAGIPEPLVRRFG